MSRDSKRGGRAVATISTPIGRIAVGADGRAVRVVHLLGDGERELAGEGDPDPRAQRLARRGARELAEYFAGRRRRFAVPVEPRGTPFQERVWRALRRVPFGATCSYGDLARAVGRPGAARAVGGANHANPIALIVPCHRVIASDGTLGGYGGGLDKKAWLLRHERGEVVARSAAR